MKTLIYGAGPLGSLYAYLFHKAGIDVTILARNDHYNFLVKNGIILVNEFSGEKFNRSVRVVNSLKEDDFYDLVIVLMRKNNVKNILHVLANNKHVPNFLFMGNNVNSFAEYLRFLPQEKVLFGFPGGGGSRLNHVVHFVDSDKSSGKRMPITLGEIDGISTERIINIKNLFESAKVPVKIEKNIDGWLKYHAAFILPLAGALLKSGDNYKLANDNNTIKTYIKAINEGGKILNELNYKNQFPPKIKSFNWNPEWITTKILRSVLKTKFAEVAMMMHVNSARDEMKELGKEFTLLKNKTSVDASNLEELLAYTN
jgi:2-dehydropantoate 2-reductase